MADLTKREMNERNLRFEDLSPEEQDELIDELEDQGEDWEDEYDDDY